MYKLCRILYFSNLEGEQISISSTFLYGQSYWLTLWLEVSTELLIWEVAVLCGLLLLDVHVSPMWCEGGRMTKGRKDSCWSSRQSTCIPQCLSPRPNWDPPPVSRKRVCPLPGTKGGDSLACRWGGSKFGRLEKNPSTLCTLWSTICTIASRS